MRKRDCKMRDVTSETWTKLYEIETKAQTIAGLLKAYETETGDKFYHENYDNEGFDSAETFFANDIRNGWIEWCEDGIIVWMA